MNHFFGFWTFICGNDKSNPLQNCCLWMNAIYLFFFVQRQIKGQRQLHFQFVSVWVPQKDENFHSHSSKVISAILSVHLLNWLKLMNQNSSSHFFFTLFFFFFLGYFFKKKIYSSLGNFTECNVWYYWCIRDIEAQFSWYDTSHPTNMSGVRVTLREEMRNHYGSS